MIGGDSSENERCDKEIEGRKVIQSHLVCENKKEGKRDVRLITFYRSLQIGVGQVLQAFLACLCAPIQTRVVQKKNWTVGRFGSWVVWVEKLGSWWFRSVGFSLGSRPTELTEIVFFFFLNLPLTQGQ